jgi:hypothetical protein
MIYKCILSIVVLLLSNCAYYYYVDYSLALDEAKRIGDTSKPDSSAYCKYDLYIDNNLKITWNPMDLTYKQDRGGLGFRLQNFTSETMRILWDEASFIDIDGMNHRLIHYGTKFIEKEETQIPSIISSGTSFFDMLFPSDHIKWQEGTGSLPGDWMERCFINHCVQKDTFDEKVIFQCGDLYLGRKFSILFPIMIGSKKTEYLFVFRIISKRTYHNSSGELTRIDK